MAYPPAYTRTASFTDWETTNPGEPKPGVDLDTEFDNVSNALTGTQTALALIQRADGALANDSVGPDQLQDGLFDAIADDAVADAEAAAAAAAASASAAASSALSAATSDAAAAGSAAAAAGAAASASVSQGIAQSAADDAEASADDAADEADAAELAANSVLNSVAQAQIHEEMAFKWAEYLAAPVAPAPPGWPEAVDDGMFSAKWWALRARDYNEVHHYDFGTAGTDIGNAFDLWDASNDLEDPPGLVYATWGTPPHTYALTDPSDPSDPASWTDITGGPGPAGPPNTLTIGTVVSGTPAAATITGTSPNQVLSLTIPPGATGATGATGPTGAAGAAGPPNTLNIGTVTTGAPGSPAAASITGSAPSQTLSLTIPAGADGAVGPPGPTNYANPTAVIGLTAVNGSLANTMRSDAAPALSQAIAPTWTGDHTFNATVDLAGPLEAAGVEGISGHVLASQGAGLPPIWRTPGGGAIELGWNFSSAVGTANPGSQKMSLNSAIHSGVNTAVFNSLAFTNFDANTILSLLRQGNRIYMQQRNDATKAALYEVTGAGTNLTGYWTIPVSLVNSVGTMFPNNADMNVVFIMSASTSTSFGNPTASIGLTAVNGSATTAMRSDAAPPLSVGISPDWTGFHTFGGAASRQTTTRIASRGLVNAFEWGHSNAAGFGSTLGYAKANGRPFLAFHAEHGTNDNTFMTRGVIGKVITTDAAGTIIMGRVPVASADNQALTTEFYINATGTAFFTGALDVTGSLSLNALTNSITNASGPLLKYIASAAAADEKNWRTRNFNGTYIVSTENDAGTEQQQALAFSRTGAALVTMSFGASTCAYNFIGSGLMSVAGGMVCGGATSGNMGVGTINAKAFYDDGVLLAPSTGANPTGTVGLAAVNGVLTTFLRSDGAPALSQAIAPTWTATHIFAFGGTGGGQLVLRNTAPATDAKNTLFRVDTAGNFAISSSQDATPATAMRNLIAATRALHAWTVLDFGNTFENLTYNFQGTGLVTVSGSIVVGAPTSGNMGVGTINATGLYVNGVAVGSGAAGANPTGTVGLTAVNGSAGTFLRSDGAPALSQAINPVWTGSHTWSHASPTLLWLESDQAADERRWKLVVNSKVFTLRTYNDAESTSSIFLQATRGTGIAMTNVSLGNATDNPTYSFLGTGTATFGGQVFVPLGTVSLPTLAFGAALGVYAPSTSQVAIVTGTTTFTTTFTPGVINLSAPLSNREFAFQTSGVGRWSFRVNNTAEAGSDAGSDFLLRRHTDAGAASTWLQVTRSTGAWAITGDGTITGAATFSGAVSAASFTSTSARAIKRETGSVRRASNVLAKLRPLLYRLLAGDDREQLGLIAEEVHEVCPQLSDGKAVAYDRLAILLLAAWQEEHAEAA